VTLPWLLLHPPLLGPAVLQPQEIRELTAPLVRDDWIADWTTGWGPDAMADLVPHERVRAAVLAEGHELPADFSDVAVPVPQEWPDDDVRYVHLSASYDAEAAAARVRGWTVVGDGTGAHLDVADDPGRIAHLLG
jgi:hypothetical protein